MLFSRLLSRFVGVVEESRARVKKEKSGGCCRDTMTRPNVSSPFNATPHESLAREAHEIRPFVFYFRSYSIACTPSVSSLRKEPLLRAQDLLLVIYI